MDINNPDTSYFPSGGLGQLVLQVFCYFIVLMGMVNCTKVAYGMATLHLEYFQGHI